MRTINDYREFVLQHMSRDEVREIGNLRLKETWVVAAEYCKQTVYTVTEEVTTAATQATEPATNHAEAVCDVLYSETSRTIVQWFSAAVLATVYTLGLIVYRIAQIAWQATSPSRQRLMQRRDDWLTAQASLLVLVLLILRGIWRPAV